MSKLYIKKMQIQNAMDQKLLTSKLSDAQSDLSTVQSALDKVENTREQFTQSRVDIQSTIDTINAQLAELKGQPAPKSAAAAASSTASAGGHGGGSSDDGDQASQSQSSDQSSDSSSDEDVVDKQEAISNKIDSIKSIVDALSS